MNVQSIQYSNDIYMNHYRYKIYKTYEDNQHGKYIHYEYHMSSLYNRKGQLERVKVNSINITV